MVISNTCLAIVGVVLMLLSILPYLSKSCITLVLTVGWNSRQANLESFIAGTVLR